MNAIILDGNLKSALAAVRSLGDKGVFVSVGAEHGTGMALHSKYVKARFVYPSPYTDRAAFVRAVKAEAVRLGGKPVIYTFSDATYLSLYEARADLSEYATLIFPEQKSVEIAFDKGATYSIARVSGVPTITTHAPETRAEIERLAPTLRYPVVLKTRRSVTWRDDHGIFGSASFIHSESELVEKFLVSKETLGEAPLIQPLIVGEEYGVEMLTKEGNVYALVVHRRLRSLSPTGGASVLKETLAEGVLFNTLVGYSEKLVTVLKWSGPIMVEWKVDSDSREPKLMEINGRFWGSLPLSVAAGVDMPYLYYQLTQGELLSEKVSARPGVTTRHFCGDIKHLLTVLFARNPMRKTHYPKRKQAVKDFVRLPKGTESDVWSWRDPLPAFYEVVDILKRVWN